MRRFTGRLSCLVVLLALIVACGGPPASSDTGATEASAPPATGATEASAPPTAAPSAAQASVASEMADTQELIVGAWADEFTQELNKPRLGMYPLNASICEPLVKLTHDFQLEPGLATEWEYRGDNTYRFKLRPDVTFHDGSPLTAEAVKYTLDYSVKMKTQYSFLDETSTTVIDDMTVDVRPAQPNLRVLQQLVHPTYAIIAPNSDPTVEPVCTGPFRFVEYVKEDHLTVERNDDYWGEKPPLQKITFRFLPDDNTRALALQSGEVDAIFNVNRGLVDGLKSTPGIKIVTAPPGAVFMLYMTSQGPEPYTKMSDPKLRRAVALAIDRQSLAEKVLEGYGEVVDTVNPPTVLGEYASLVEGIPYDPEEAARLLDEAGWEMGPDNVRVKDGERLTLITLPHPTRVDATLAQYIQAQLAAVGIEAKLEQLENAAYTERLNSGQFDLDIEMPNQNDANPAFLVALRWYSKSSVKSAPFVASGPEYDALIDKALTTADHAEVQKTAAEAMHLLLDEQVIAAPLAGVYRIYAMKEQVEGFEPHPSGTNQWWDTVWMAK